MNVDDLLDLIREDLLGERMGAGYEDVAAWSEGFLIREIGNAQRQACYRQDLRHLYDDSTFSITLATGVQSYALDHRILRIEEIQFGTAVLEHTTLANLDQYAKGWRSYSAGAPKRFYIRGRTLFLDRAPSATENGQSLNLTVWREPLADPDTGDELEWVDDPEKLGHWVAFKAFSRRDEDVANPGSAKMHLDLFNQAFGDEVPVRARMEILQYPDVIQFRPAMEKANYLDNSSDDGW